MLTGIACCCAGGDAGAGAAAFGGVGALDFGSGGFCCAGVSRVILHISRPPASSIPATQPVTAKKDRTRIKALGGAPFIQERMDCRIEPSQARDWHHQPKRMPARPPTPPPLAP